MAMGRPRCALVRPSPRTAGAISNDRPMPPPGVRICMRREVALPASPQTAHIASAAMEQVQYCCRARRSRASVAKPPAWLANTRPTPRPQSGPRGRIFG